MPAERVRRRLAHFDSHRLTRFGNAGGAIDPAGARAAHVVSGSVDLRGRMPGRGAERLAVVAFRQPIGNGREEDLVRHDRSGGQA